MQELNVKMRKARLHFEGSSIQLFGISPEIKERFTAD